MRVRLEKSSFLLALLYAASLLVSSAHELLFERKDCARCEEMARAGTTFQSGCDGSGPCQNPDHHHHRGKHRHDQCPLCQGGKVNSSPSTTLEPRSIEHIASAKLDRRESVPPRFSFLESRPARAPPSFS